MFKFLKEKLKKSLGKISEEIEEQGTEEEISAEEQKIDVQEQSKDEKKGFFSRIFGRKKTDVAEYEEVVEKVESETKEEIEAEEKVKPRKVKEKKSRIKKKELGTEIDVPSEVLKSDKNIQDEIKEDYNRIVEEAEAKDTIKDKKKETVTAEKLVKEAIAESSEKEYKPTAEEIIDEISDSSKFEEIKDELEQAKEDLDEAIVKHEPEKIKKAKAEVEDVKKKVDDLAAKKAKEEKVGELKAEVKQVKAVVKQKVDDDVLEEEKGFFGRLKQKIVTTKINQEQFDKLFWDLELVLLENNVAVEVIDKIKEDLKFSLVDRPIRRGKVQDVVIGSLKSSLESLFDVTPVDLINEVKKKKPFVICFVGINGSGKTTSIAKFARFLMDNKLKCVMAAADTFRAAAIQQLEEHANKLGVKIIKHDYGSDAAAVAFDAVKYANAHGIDVVLIDTAGRMHSNVNLMDEVKKLIRVAKPNLKIFVGESITGNDCVEQASKFNEAIGIDGIVLSKADVDEKGGAAISVSYITKKPIMFIGTGQGYKDLEIFDSSLVLEGLGL